MVPSEYATKYNVIEMKFQGRNAVFVQPGNHNGRIVFKTEYLNAFPNVEEALLEQGFCLAHIQNSTRWGTEDNTDMQHAFLTHISNAYRLDRRAVLVGMSCGGMQAIYLAAKYPEDVAVLYLDAPVINLLSCPCDLGIGHSGLYEEFFGVTGLTKSDLLSYRKHPLDKLADLAPHNIPLVLVYGDSDDVVPYSENGMLVEQFYKEHHLPLQTFCKPGCGHHPHSLPDPTPIVEFIINNLR